MILRHITKVKYLPNIICEDCLNPKYNPKTSSSDKNYISFEVFQQNDALLKCYTHFKEVRKEEVVELFFDADKMSKDGINILNEFESGGKHTKLELQFCVPTIISQDEYDSIGEYRFVRGPVFLKYLTDKSSRDLEDWKLKYYMEQLRKTIQAQLSLVTADKNNYDGIEDRLTQLDQDINEILKKINKL